MKLDLKQKLFNEEGEILKDGNKELNLKRVVERAALFTLNDESSEDKDKDFEIYLRLKANTNGIVDLSAKDITRLQAKVGKIFSILINGQVCRLLDGKDNPLAEIHPPKPPKPPNGKPD